MGNFKVCQVRHGLAATSISPQPHPTPPQPPSLQPCLYRALSSISLHSDSLAFCAEVPGAFLHFYECTELLPEAHTLHMLFPLPGTKSLSASPWPHKIIFNFLLNHPFLNLTAETLTSILALKR